uniref:Uncharacterized protein n=1 Tax=Mycena chlorophos TaxID=658473 RepID=A0ABQ0L2L1_MYCCL|nr:predicted protein [Mycena chlorophos]
MHMPKRANQPSTLTRVNAAQTTLSGTAVVSVVLALVPHYDDAARKIRCRTRPGLASRACLLLHHCPTSPAIPGCVICRAWTGGDLFRDVSAAPAFGRGQFSKPLRRLVGPGKHEADGASINPKRLVWGSIPMSSRLVPVQATASHPLWPNRGNTPHIDYTATPPSTISWYEYGENTHGLSGAPGSATFDAPVLYDPLATPVSFSPPALSSIYDVPLAEAVVQAGHPRPFVRQQASVFPHSRPPFDAVPTRYDLSPSRARLGLEIPAAAPSAWRDAYGQPANIGVPDYVRGPTYDRYNPNDRYLGLLPPARKEQPAPSNFRFPVRSDAGPFASASHAQTAVFPNDEVRIGPGGRHEPPPDFQNLQFRPRQLQAPTQGSWLVPQLVADDWMLPTARGSLDLYGANPNGLVRPEIARDSPSVLASPNNAGRHGAHGQRAQVKVELRLIFLCR